ncbi:BRCA2-interacting transcriptional repressor EMSY [Drosophila subobscura]|uniref:BRCA2-interacting transcriptional repressor EMSY n=1 Tax=Drosophila subobscura TaxID=7241 RepID=UPI00155B37C7|nr:BRCA2-interacting transcriptional repressor EMSY [Drosophila subobscura]
MWPQTLEMSRDECRGMLRRLELESYSHIISVFRAQGSLSEPKGKMLEELRQLFHITPERHRAEVRRAVNDEQLCTIAENVCGPNTWQEWSREGRRPYPLLPRISPQTALSIVANDLAAKACLENAKLLPPAETGAHYADALIDQANLMALKHGRNRAQEPTLVIMDEPFKVPDVPNEVKKAIQKRKENEGIDAKPNKKRHMQQQQQQHDKLDHLHHQQQQHMQLLGQLPLQQSGPEDGEMVPVEPRPSPRTQQQRFFYQQQQKHKQRLASKRNLANSLGPYPGAIAAGRAAAAAAAADSAKRVAAPAKSGRRAQKQLQQQQQQKTQQHHQQQQQQQQKVLLPVPEAVPIANHSVVEPHVEYILDEALKSVSASTAIPAPAPTQTPTQTVTVSPPTGFLNKLKPLPATRVVYGPTAAAAAEMGSPTTPGVTSRGFANSPIVFKEKLQASVMPVQVQMQSHSGSGQLSTPVKKFIMEEPAAASTLPMTPAPIPMPISTANLPLAPQIISVQQIPAPPMGAKLRPALGLVNPTGGGSSSTTTTILPPGTKLTPKKINFLDGTQLEAKPKSLPSSAVRLLPYTTDTTVSTPSSPQAMSSNLKEQPRGTVTPLSSASTVNIIKNIPASSLNNTLITPLATPTATGTPIFRAKATSQPQQLPPGSVTLKAAGTGGGSSANTGAPQILGNIKLTSGTGTGSALNIKQVHSSALRNIKICSPNGKVFLQPGKLPAGSIIHKLNNVTGGSGTTTTVATASLSPTGGMPHAPSSPHQRISIQKMQILPAPTQVMSSGMTSSSTNTLTVSSGTGTAASSAKLTTKPTTLTFSTGAGGKNNLVFLPASAASGMRAVTLSTKPKPNVLVIGASTSASVVSPTAASVSPNLLTGSHSSSGGGSSSSKPKPNQMITEDTPIDIINMPIIVADNGTTTTTTTETKVKSGPLVLLNATDWEMELDQAATKTVNTTGSSKQSLDDDVIIEDVDVEEDDVVAVEVETEHEHDTLELNNRIIELHPEDDSAIEYVDMDLEQPIEIESTSNISPETSLKAAIVSQLKTKQPQQQPMEQPLASTL